MNITIDDNTCVAIYSICVFGFLAYLIKQAFKD
jgi:hypothetical protein